MSKLISTFQIGFDDETKAVLSEIKDNLDAITGSLGVPSALLGSTKANGGLLVAMGEAANDTPEPELLELGQWVFEGQPKGFITAHVNSLGQAAMSSMPIDDIKPSGDTWVVTEDAQIRVPTCLYRRLKGQFDATNWQNSAISRQPVNDVDYLSETTPEVQGMDAGDIIIDEVGRNYSSNSNCLHAVVPQITQADMQLIFIKNLSDVLIQRMHSMDRFSEDDCHIRELMPWDIVTGRNSFNDKQPNFAVVIAVSHIEHSDKSSFGIADLTSRFSLNQYVHTGQYVKITPSHNDTYRTITESELVWFRAALEACYV